MLTRLLLIAALPTLLIACNDNAKTDSNNPAASSAKSETSANPTTVSATTNGDSDGFAMVNETTITQAQLNSYSSQRTRGSSYAQLPPAQQKMLADELINLELMAQAAVDSGKADDEALKAQLALMKKELLARSQLQAWLADNEPNEATLREFYAKRQTNAGQNEFKARHILVEDENLAKELITKLNAGDDFAELAKANSKDGSAANGGDLGWFQASHMVKPFADAVQALEKNKHSSEPVKSRFGFHVILLEDSRETPAPTFDSVKQELIGEAREAKIEAYVDELRNKAKIKINAEFQAKIDSNAAAATPEGDAEQTGHEGHGH